MFGHDQYHAVTLDGRRHSQGNTRVAAGRFNEGVARLDIAAQLRMLDHAQGRPVLDRARRIITFQLG